MGKLYIETSCENGRTVVSDSRFASPFKITKPFYNGDTAEIMIMQASAGILEGDSHELEFNIRSGSRVIITGQSYTKLFKMESGRAEQNVKINVESGAYLAYLPCPVIPFGESEFINTNEIHAAKGAQLALWDIFASGRNAMGESFKFRKYHSRTIVYEDGRAVFADNTRLVPEEFNLGGMGFFEDCTHQGMAYFYGFDDINAVGTENLTAAVTKAKRGQLIRVLAYSADEAVNYLKQFI
ncbi:MAG: urease accessory protein UreD [Candidatus Ornithomonoglobus sp.]